MNAIKVRVGRSLFAGVSPTVIPAVSSPLALPVRERVSVEQVLELAAAYIEVHGHHKGDFGSEKDRSACAVGAIRAIVTGRRDVQHPLADAAVLALSQQLPDVMAEVLENVAEWNDALERTASEVVRALRAAALAVAA
ncbi:DUF6197 family protein [Kitasatospora fiedleri]|uniref:DUF6197 family protein n=1 Tax=Kitasatospora fiedleri TaxID=2991545 RepID=UPI00249A9436|nr:hypothetical protein [Kitasatospora fiedleri]